jgi:hypothetical protein
MAGGAKRRRVLVINVAAPIFVCACAAGPALAGEMSGSGSVATFSGPIRAGDEFKVRDHMARHQVRVLFLNSPGGQITAATEIGRMLRRAGVTTVVDAATSNCASACTVLFAAGARRHYVNAAGVVEGRQGLAGRGLGYHQGNQSTSVHAGGFSGAATGNMVNAYYEFGVSGAAQFLNLAGPREMYRINAATALANGIATSTARP